MAVAVRAKLWRWVVTAFCHWLVDTIWKELVVFGVLDVCLLVERAVHRWARHQDERAERRADERHHRRQALEATPGTGVAPQPRAWQTAPACERPAASHAGAPQSSRVAVGR